MQKDNLILLNKISQAVFDKKGANILALDVRPCQILPDFVVVAEGSVDKHVMAIADSIIDAMEKEGHKLSFSQGLQRGDWVVLDYTFIAVHLFVPELRDRYQLERLWQQAEIVDVMIDVAEKHCLIM